jgi:hypothetical protein
MDLTPANQGIREFLAEYCKRDSPKYAVMINGEWGSGKTWLVNTVTKLERLEFLRISLFGISTRQEIYDEFFAQCHPILASPGAKVVTGIAKGVLSRITFPIGGGEAQSQTQLDNLGLTNLLVNITGKVVILDDFERCQLSPRETLGVVSNLLEEDDCKVIIISNDEAIQEKEYISYKEKVVSYTFTAEPEIEMALKEFCHIFEKHHLPDHLMDDIRSIVISVHNQSGYKNLRHMRISIEAFERLYRKIPAYARNVGDLLKELLYINTIFSYEVLHGSIRGDEVMDLFTSIAYGNWNKSSATSSLVNKHAEKYRPAMTTDHILSADAWINLFARGSLDDKEIQESIDGSRFFLDQKSPAWRRLLEIWALSDEEMRTILNQLIQDIATENFVNAGEILHATGLLLWLCEKGLYSEEPKSIEEHSKRLLSSLQRQGKLQCRPSNRISSDKDRTYANHTYLSLSHQSFKNVLAHANAIESTIHKSNLQKCGNALLDLLPDDIHKFAKQITIRGMVNHYSDSGIFADEPVLATTEANRFVEILLDMKPMLRRDLLYALAQRYKFSDISNSLCAELEWLIDVNRLLQLKVDEMRPSLEALQLESAINDYLSPSIQKLSRPIVDD